MGRKFGIKNINKGAISYLVLGDQSNPGKRCQHYTRTTTTTKVIPRSQVFGRKQLRYFHCDTCMIQAVSYKVYTYGQPSHTDFVAFVACVRLSLLEKTWSQICPVVKILYGLCIIILYNNIMSKQNHSFHHLLLIKSSML